MQGTFFQLFLETRVRVAIIRESRKMWYLRILNIIHGKNGSPGEAKVRIHLQQLSIGSDMILVQLSSTRSFPVMQQHNRQH